MIFQFPGNTAFLCSTFGLLRGRRCEPCVFTLEMKPQQSAYFWCRITWSLNFSEFKFSHFFGIKFEIYKKWFLSRHFWPVKRTIPPGDSMWENNQLQYRFWSKLVSETCWIGAKDGFASPRWEYCWDWWFLRSPRYVLTGEGCEAHLKSRLNSEKFQNFDFQAWIVIFEEKS